MKTNKISIEMHEYYHRVEYLAENLTQKLREMETPVNDFLAEASAFGTEYKGPSCEEELYELQEVLRERPNKEFT